MKQFFKIDCRYFLQLFYIFKNLSTSRDACFEEQTSNLCAYELKASIEEYEEYI